MPTVCLVTAFNRRAAGRAASAALVVRVSFRGSPRAQSGAAVSGTVPLEATLWRPDV